MSSARSSVYPQPSSRPFSSGSVYSRLWREPFNGQDLAPKRQPAIDQDFVHGFVAVGPAEAEEVSSEGGGVALRDVCGRWV